MNTGILKIGLNNNKETKIITNEINGIVKPLKKRKEVTPKIKNNKIKIPTINAEKPAAPLEVISR